MRRVFSSARASEAGAVLRGRVDLLLGQACRAARWSSSPPLKIEPILLKSALVAVVDVASAHVELGVGEPRPRQVDRRRAPVVRDVDGALADLGEVDDRVDRADRDEERALAEDRGRQRR